MKRLKILCLVLVVALAGETIWWASSQHHTTSNDANARVRFCNYYKASASAAASILRDSKQSSEQVKALDRFQNLATEPYFELCHLDAVAFGKKTAAAMKSYVATGDLSGPADVAAEIAASVSSP